MLDKELLSRFSFFSDIADDGLVAIAQLGQLLDFKAGDIIFRNGESSDHLYGVVTGEVELSLVYQDKVLKADIKYEEENQSRIEAVEKPIKVAVVDPGMVFGWSALASRRRRTLTAKCPGPCQLIGLPGDALKALFDKDASLGYKIMTQLSDLISGRLKDRTEKLIEAWVEAFDMDSL
jgi:CRP-like cAMP-binding protein